MFLADTAVALKTGTPGTALQDTEIVAGGNLITNSCWTVAK